MECRVCGEKIGRGPWLLLNRFGVGTGTNRCLSLMVGEDGYLWETSENTDDEYVSGPVLHWPECARAYVEGCMAETDHHFKPPA